MSKIVRPRMPGTGEAEQAHQPKLRTVGQGPSRQNARRPFDVAAMFCLSGERAFNENCTQCRTEQDVYFKFTLFKSSDYAANAASIVEHGNLSVTRPSCLVNFGSRDVPLSTDASAGDKFPMSSRPSPSALKLIRHQRPQPEMLQLLRPACFLGCTTT